MRLFVYEYTCANHSNDNSRAEALRTEGEAMLFAVAADLCRVPGVNCHALISAAHADLLSSLRLLGIEATVHSSESHEAHFRELARHADGTLVIAPEFDGILGQRCLWVEDVVGRLVGPSAEAVRMTGDKWELAQIWKAHSVPTPPILLASSALAPYPAVLKPRFGAGSLATFLILEADELPKCHAQAEHEGWRGEMILQALVRGAPCSVAFLVGPAGTVALAPCRQILSEDGRFQYQGGSLPLAPALADRAIALGRRAIECVPGLRGYVGVDVVLGHAPDGSEDAVIEINPRLTTSYIGLRALAEANLGETMLQIASDDALQGLRWQSGSVRFFTDGRVERSQRALES
jgi:predicted ATP-grasp superfamily ATP-dependent carboligase